MEHVAGSQAIIGMRRAAHPLSWWNTRNLWPDPPALRIGPTPLLPHRFNLKKLKKKIKVF
jgi:hypothetical protein